jgi:hypothetical protein
MRQAQLAAQRKTRATATTGVDDAALSRLWQEQGLGWWQGVILAARRALGKVGGIASAYAKYLILLGIFSFKFLEWWYSPSNQLQRIRKLPVPPPPPARRPAATGVLVPADKSLCPICTRVRTNPAASTSGYVFWCVCVCVRVCVRVYFV